MPPYGLMYRFGFLHWEQRNVEESWRPLFERPDAPAPGRALDVGCGSGRDAVFEELREGDDAVLAAGEAANRPI